MMLLSNEVAIITGGGSARGIGRATAQLFAEHGARVAVLDIDGVSAQQVGRELGDAHRGYRCDVTDQSEVVAVFRQVAEELGPPTILVNNAGVTQPKRIDQITISDYDIVMDVSLRGAFLCSQAVLPFMRQCGRGSIICISSVSAKRGGGIFGGPHYSAAKAGMLGLARALARDLAPENIRVNAIAPGLVDTDITGGQISAERMAAIIKDIPLGRIAQPLDIARACLFFASSLAGYVTGEVMDVNGGSHID
jgi:NAD(P)-dependent dehydrogenase (short-subunit alcohol dehydrogenase family)